MGYQLIYNSSFKDIDENTINIEIYRDSGGTDNRKNAPVER